jgi:hypothetical protein
MLESLEIGVERDPCQTYPTVVANAVIEEGLDLTLAESAGSAESLKAMERSEILETGHARDLYLPSHSRIAAQEMAGAHEQMMAHPQRASGTEEHPLLNGARAAPHQDRKMEAQDPQDGNSRNDLLLSAHPQLPSRITNGVPR